MKVTAGGMPLSGMQVRRVRFGQEDTELKAPMAPESKAPKPAEGSRLYVPKPNDAVIFTAKQLNRALLGLLGVRVEINSEDLTHLNGMFRQVRQGDFGMILTPNHSSDLDIPTMVETFRQSGMRSTVMAAREVFEPEVMGIPLPFVAWILQRFGVFSVERESADKSATKGTAVDVIANRNEVFSMFPEGYVTLANMRVDELKNGAADIALAVVQQGKKDVLVVPLGFYFHHQRDISPELKRILNKLENRVGEMLDREPDHTGGLYERINRLGRLLIDEREQHYRQRFGIPTLKDAGNPTDDLYERLCHMREQLLQHFDARYPDDRASQGQQKPGATGGNHEIRTRRLIGRIRRQQLQLRQSYNALQEEKKDVKKERIDRFLWGGPAPAFELSPEMVSKMLEGTGVTPAPSESIEAATAKPAEKRTLRERYEEIRLTLADLRIRNAELQEHVEVLKEVMNLASYPSHYLAGQEKQNRLMETIVRLHRDIMGRSVPREKQLRLKLMRKARVVAKVDVGQPISAREFFQNGPDPRSASRALTERIRQGIQEGIDRKASESESEPQ